MRFSLITLVVCVFASGQVLAAPEDDNSFCVNFYQKPNFEVDAGVSCRELDVGKGAGSPKGKMVVASLTAPDWMQVTLFNDYYYKGGYKVFRGNVPSIDPPLTVHSVKFLHI